MITYTLKRHIHPDAVFGMLIGADSIPIGVTLELPWKNNARMVSSIPAGTYRCKRVKSPKFGITFEITGVPGRSAVLFHWGNRTKDSNGCVLIGHGFDPVDGDKKAIVNSKKEFAEFMASLDNIDEFFLTVVNT